MTLPEVVLWQAIRGRKLGGARDVLGNLEGVLTGLRERVCVKAPPPRRRGPVVGSHASLPPPPMGEG